MHPCLTEQPIGLQLSSKLCSVFRDCVLPMGADAETVIRGRLSTPSAFVGHIGPGLVQLAYRRRARQCSPPKCTNLGGLRALQSCRAPLSTMSLLHNDELKLSATSAATLAPD